MNSDDFIQDKRSINTKDQWEIMQDQWIAMIFTVIKTYQNQRVMRNYTRPMNSDDISITKDLSIPMNIVISYKADEY